jgi:F-type H+-transporting ATPase subunit b
VRTRRAYLPALIALAALLPVSAARAEGMPQLDFNNPLTTSQIVWGAIIFVLFYILLSRWALPQVTSVLEDRERSIAGDLDAARAAKAHADAAIAEVDAATKRARAEAQASINEAAERAKVEAERRATEVNSRLDTQLAEAEARINAQRQAAMGALRQVATEAAIAMITRLTGQSADSAVLESAVGSALATRGRS